MRNELVVPMALYVFYIGFLGILNARARVRAVRRGHVPAKYFKTYHGPPPPDDVIVMGRHFDNQFQVPLLFLIVCAAHLANGSANLTTVVVAWAFLASRIVHTIVHLGRNFIPVRMAAFGLGLLLTMVQAMQLLLARPLS